jgi:hypothetical protein
MILITLQRVSNLSNPPAACNNLPETNLKKKLSFLLDNSPVIVAEWRNPAAPELLQTSQLCLRHKRVLSALRAWWVDDEKRAFSFDDGRPAGSSSLQLWSVL